MIIARIIPHAGLGNQMFMYAAGLATAERLNTELRLGAWDFEQRTTSDRPYHLPCFPAITERNASFAEIWKISPRAAVLDNAIRCPMKKRHIFRRVLRKLASKILPEGTVYQPEYCSYAPEFDNISDNTYMVGYWESEMSFAGIKALVRKKFTFPSEYFDTQFRACNSVAVHVRRTDKASEDGFYASNLHYLSEALDTIIHMTDSPKFFVFSDDILWCRENLPKIYPADFTFIEGQTPPQDMALMTKCKHVIMGPSTFSWWGAWLNDNPHKIVIAPDINLWYRQLTNELIEDRKYLLPSEWLKIG